MKMLPIGLFSMVVAVTSPALASGKIFYGSRIGMTVTVVSMSGLDTSQATIKTKHTREDAIGFCRDYVGKVTPDCIREELAVRLNDEIFANCPRGEFVDFRGNRYRFLGESTDKDSMAKYVLKSLPSGEIADGSSASGYPTNIQIFKALCPSRAPLEE
ncbi:hypothetical protein [Methylobacterium aerolatum]|uniref:Uncharacterized protein n=1 Tax=Methylobacterium aerolatum TaxID=418708 RepID=A0ABU0HZU2_9HYPH|nr:hypothetical protein [Methylobacterium aerolatum]MDQ0446984.1 hypothetical protein [Methylobacterium aerolatum]